MDPSLGLLVTSDDPRGVNGYIYRDASGIRWDPSIGAFKAHEPERWDLEAVIKAILAATSRELGIDLRSDESTKWLNGTSRLEPIATGSDGDDA